MDGAVIGGKCLNYVPDKPVSFYQNIVVFLSQKSLAASTGKTLSMKFMVSYNLPDKKYIQYGVSLSLSKSSRHKMFTDSSKLPSQSEFVILSPRCLP